MTPACCPYCGVITSRGGTVEWRGLSVDWQPVAIHWQGDEMKPPALTPARFLHVLVAAQGLPVRIGLFDTMIGMDAGVETRRTQFTKLRRWLERSGLPFEVPKMTSWNAASCRLVALG